MTRGGDPGTRFHSTTAWDQDGIHDKARARMRLVERGAKKADGEALLCECGAALDAWDLEREMERPKVVLCCSKKGCSNSARATARIFRAELPKEES